MCNLVKASVTFLGYIISAEGCTSLPQKVLSIQQLFITKARKVRRFRDYIKDATILQAPLDKLLSAPRKGSKSIIYPKNISKLLNK